MPQDDAETVRWFRKVADEGDIDAQYSLGLMCTVGGGVPQDYVLAYMWSKLAASQGNDGATSLRELVTGKMTPEQIAEADKLAREWKPK